MNLKLFLSSWSQTSFQSDSNYSENKVVAFPAGLQQSFNSTQIRIKMNMFLFQLVSNKLAKQMWWQNKKTQLAIGGGAVLLILLIIIIICCSWDIFPLIILWILHFVSLSSGNPGESHCHIITIYYLKRKYAIDVQNMQYMQYMYKTKYHFSY